MPDLPHAPDPAAPALLHPQERDRMLAALRGLLRRVTVAGRPVAGLAAESSPGALLRALDNAVAAEALGLPGIRAVDPVLAAAPLTFLAALAEAGEDGALPRAVATPMAQVAIREADPAALRVVTPWHVLTGDLTRGVLIQALRGEEDDPGRAVQHTGNLVRLSPAGVRGLPSRLGLKPPTLDVEDAVAEAGVVQDGRGVLLFHESMLRLPAVPGLRAGPAATIRYEYRVSPDDPILRLTVVLRAASGVALHAARVSTALDALSRTVPPMRGAAVTVPGHAPVPTKGRGAFEDAWHGLSDLVDPGNAEVLHLWSPAAASGDALSIHLCPRGGARLHSVRAQAQGGAIHWVILRHDLGPIPAGGAATVEEDRLLLRGRLPATLTRAAARLRDPAAGAPADPGLTAEPALLGSLANALPGAFGWAPAEAAAARLRPWLDAALDAALTRPGALHPGLALAAEALHRAGSDPDGARLHDVAARLGPVEDAASLLAAVRLAPRFPEVAAAVRDSALLRAADRRRLESLPTVELATLLRALRAAARSGAVPRDLPAEVAAACFDVLSARLRPRGEALDVAPSAEADTGDALSIAATLVALLEPEDAARNAAPWHAG